MQIDCRLDRGRVQVPGQPCSQQHGFEVVDVRQAGVPDDESLRELDRLLGAAQAKVAIESERARAPRSRPGWDD